MSGIGAPRAARVVAWRWLGRVPFAATAQLQEALRAEIIAGQRGETLLLCEHHPVVTLGRSARREHVLLAPEVMRARGIEVEPASRGGDVTYHGPGQLVGYPIFRLHDGVVAHVQRMARVIIAVLGARGVEAEFRRAQPGVWVGNNKICAFGIHVRHRVAVHGFALNVSVMPETFSCIVPCGLPSAGVTSIAAQQPAVPPPEVGDLISAVVAAFAYEFSASLCKVDG